MFQTFQVEVHATVRAYTGEVVLQDAVVSVGVPAHSKEEALEVFAEILNDLVRQKTDFGDD